MKSRAEENYLKALLHLSQKDVNISTNDISKKLNIKMPTVTGMMKKFAQKGWVEYQSYKPIRLTPEGKKEASLIVRKHRLTEMFLVEIMGFSWDSVHEIAEQMEHIKSKAFFDKMDEMLNYPTQDPHGAPIPDIQGFSPEQGYVKLNQCSVGEEVIIMSVNDNSSEFLQFLGGLELTLGKKIKITAIHEFDGSLSIEYRGKELLLSKAASEMISVQKA